MENKRLNVKNAYVVRVYHIHRHIGSQNDLNDIYCSDKNSRPGNRFNPFDSNRKIVKEN